MQITKKHIHSILDGLNDLSTNVFNSKKTLCDKYSVEYNSEDARITIFAKLMNSITSSKYSLLFLGECLLCDKWVAKHYDKSKSNESIQIDQGEYYKYIKIAFVQCCFMAIESNLRIILRTLDPKACDNSTSEFKSIYECLLKNSLSKPYLELIKLLDLMRIIRNTVHNNGVYFHKSRETIEIELNDQKYIFRHGEKLTFVDWPLIIKTFNQIFLQLALVLADKKLFLIKGIMQDPFSVKLPNDKKSEDRSNCH